MLIIQSTTRRHCFQLASLISAKGGLLSIPLILELQAVQASTRVNNVLEYMDFVASDAAKHKLALFYVASCSGHSGSNQVAKSEELMK